jgi:hypothetical protein
LDHLRMFFQADHQAVLEQTMARHKEVTMAAISSLQDRMQPPGAVSGLVVVCMLFVYILYTFDIMRVEYIYG